MVFKLFSLYSNDVIVYTLKLVELMNTSFYVLFHLCCNGKDKNVPYKLSAKSLLYSAETQKKAIIWMSLFTPVVWIS